MMKEILLCTNGLFPEKEFLSFLKASKIPHQNLSVKGDRASLLLEEKDAMHFIAAFPAFAEDFPTPIAGVFGEEGTPYLVRFLKSALFVLPGQISSLAALLLKTFSFGDFSLLPELNFIFRGLDPELIKTGEFCLASLRGDYASESLYIHRNTLLYRLNRFEEETHLDLRNFQDALLFTLFLYYGHA